MQIQGYLGLVEPRWARGWAYDRLSPDSHVTVEFLCGDTSLGFVTANLYREDLRAANKGKGDHAFVFNFPSPIAQTDLPNIIARVVTTSGKSVLLARSRPALPTANPISFQGSTVDNEQHPVFVLGAARSGTSAVAQALLSTTRYRGYDEGHIMLMLPLIAGSISKFYEQKSDFLVHTALRDVPSDYFERALQNVVLTIARQLFPGRHWVDKTPDPVMIGLAPQLLQIWPNARFIFLKRRGIENMVSRGRKYPALDFAYHAGEWAKSMRAWAEVRDRLKGRALEVEHLLLARSPETVGRLIGSLLPLSDEETEKLVASLERAHPEQTSSNFAEVYDVADLDWSAEEKAIFEEICGEMMETFNYTTDRAYTTAELRAELI